MTSRVVNSIVLISTIITNKETKMKNLKAINNLSSKVYDYTLNYDNAKGLELVKEYRSLLGKVWEFEHVSQAELSALKEVKSFWASHGLNVEADFWNK